MKLIVLITCLCIGLAGFAQQEVPRGDPRLTSIEKSLDTFNPQTQVNQEIDSLSYVQTVNPEWNAFVESHRMKAFTWQHNSGIIIFILVILIVLFGIYLSYYQFRLGKKMILKQMEINERLKTSDQNLDILKADLQINKDGVKISTAVIGLAILVISVVFFFLYLKYVYPLHEI